LPIISSTLAAQTAISARLTQAALASQSTSIKNPDASPLPEQYFRSGVLKINPPIYPRKARFLFNPEQSQRIVGFNPSAVFYKDLFIQKNTG
jgi:hypothetical protein